MGQKSEYIQKLKKWYAAIDADSSGDVTLDELLAHLEEPVVLEFARTLDIEILDVKQFFMMLSGNSSKPVDLDSFVTGCIKLRGLAKSIDLLTLVHTSRELLGRQHEDQNQFKAFCLGEFDAMRQVLGIPRAERGQ